MILSNQNSMNSIQSGEAANSTCRSEQVFQSVFSVALIEAVVAGVIVSLVLYVLNRTANRYETAGTVFAKVFLPTLSSYILVALSFKKRWFVASIPSWLLIPSVGTALALMVPGIPNAIFGWHHALPQPPLSVYVIGWCLSAATIWAALNLVLLPITLILHYGRRIIQNMTQ